MARMQAQDYQAKREHIKQQAAALFANKGFHGTSIVDIAAACNTVKSRLYYYFPSKNRLLYEIIKDHAIFLQNQLSPILKDPTLQGMDIDARRRLENYACTLLGINVKYRDEHTLILGQLGALTPPQNREVSLLIRRTIEMLYPCLLEINPALQKHLYFPTAMMFVGMVNWTHTWYAGQRDGKAEDMSVENFAKRLSDTFVDGYGA